MKVIKINDKELFKVGINDLGYFIQRKKGISENKAFEVMKSIILIKDKPKIRIMRKKSTRKSTGKVKTK